MARRYVIEGDVADDIFYTEEMSADYGFAQIFVAFYDVNGDPVTPTAGTIAHDMQGVEGQWLGASAGDSPINAIDCIAAPASSTYITPTYKGLCTMGRIQLDSIAGADTFKAVIARW